MRAGSPPARLHPAPRRSSSRAGRRRARLDRGTVVVRIGRRRGRDRTRRIALLRRSVRTPVRRRGDRNERKDERDSSHGVGLRRSMRGDGHSWHRPAGDAGDRDAHHPGLDRDPPPIGGAARCRVRHARHGGLVPRTRSAPDRGGPGRHCGVHQPQPRSPRLPPGHGRLRSGQGVSVRDAGPLARGDQHRRPVRSRSDRLDGGRRRIGRTDAR